MNEPDSRVLLAFYGDDFTGSTDAMEATALAGLRTVLFTTTPDAALRERFADYAVVGIAGLSRARSPDWMEEHLPAPFHALAALRPRIVQYKVCSTFDSSPTTGSIGRAIDIGTRIVGGRWSPSIIGAPHLGRWQMFGHLFAAAGDRGNFRLDRHPTMAGHPVTPMAESDLRRHLSEQTDRPVESVDFVDLAACTPDPSRSDCPVVFLDVLDERTQRQAGRTVWEGADDTVFSASSSGLQHALVAHWRDIGIIPKASPPVPRADPVERLLVLSGSCSPVTDEQIGQAERAGFRLVRTDVVAAIDPGRANAELDRVLAAIETGFEASARGVVVYAARTTEDPAFEQLKDEAVRRGIPLSDAQEALGSFLGRVAREAVPRFQLQRLLVAGGDTSGHVVGALPIDALEVVHPLAPGVPICRCHSRQADHDGLQIALKGGQVGGPMVFENAMGKGADD